MKLTKKVIDAAKHPASGQVFLRDDELKGFCLRVTPGSKSFCLERAVHGRVRRGKIGRYPDLTVEQARQQAHEMIVAIGQGKDPFVERRQRRDRLPTFGELIDLYRQRHLIHRKSAINDEGVFRHHLAHWRNRPLTSITRGDIIKLHTKIGTTPSSVVRPGRPKAVPMPRHANYILSLLRLMFNLAADWGLNPGPNPCLRIKRFPEVSRDRFVKPDELPNLWQAIQEEPNVFVRAALFVSILTGARREEVLTMKWADLDTTQGLWRIPETKSGRVHLLPLPRPVLAELQKLPRFDGNDYVFAGRWRRSHLVNVTAPWHRIRQAAGIADVRLHDLRRTLGSWLVAQGHSLPLIGKALNHSSVSTTQVYARLQLDPVREALEINATKMLGYRKQHGKQKAKTPAAVEG